MKIQITLGVLVVFVSGVAFGMGIKRVEKIELSQEKTFIQSAASIAVTEDNIIFLTDLKAGDIKIYDNTGTLLSVWGRKGAGPNEFLMPYYSDYKKGKLAMMDFGKRKIFILERKKKFNLEISKEMLCTGLGDDICLHGDRLLISGYKVDKQGETHNLYTQNLNDGSVDFLLPIATKYGFKSYREFQNEDKRTRFYSTLSRVGYCDWQGEHVYYVWQGDLKIFKIDVQSKKTIYFGNKTSHYVQPFVTKNMITARERRDRKTNTEVKSNMSIIIGLFVHNDYLGVMYTRVSKSKDSKPGPMLQFYTLDGKFLDEVEMPGYPSSSSFFRKSDNTIFSVDIEGVDNENQDLDDKKYILKYEITR